MLINRVERRDTHTHTHTHIHPTSKDNNYRLLINANLVITTLQRVVYAKI